MDTLVLYVLGAGVVLSSVLLPIMTLGLKVAFTGLIGIPGLSKTLKLLGNAENWTARANAAIDLVNEKLEQERRAVESRKSEDIAKEIQRIESEENAYKDLENRLTTRRKKIEELEAQAAKQRERAGLTASYASLMEFVNKRLESDIYEKRLGLMHQIKHDLEDLSNRLTHHHQHFNTDNLKKSFPRGPARVVVYIDDLDRCPPDRVVEVLEAVQLLVKTPLFIAILAIDERYIARALEKYYEGVLLRRGRPSGTDYLEKIIQIPYRVRPITHTVLEDYLKAQVVVANPADGGAKFNELTQEEYDTLTRCCLQVDLSPRTLKRLINVYKLFKVIYRRRQFRKPDQKLQQAMIALLALAGRYPDLMRDVLENIATYYEEHGDKKEDSQKKKLTEFFTKPQLFAQDVYLEREWNRMYHDVHEGGKLIPKDLTLEPLEEPTFHLISSFCFVGDIGYDPDDFKRDGRVLAPLDEFTDNSRMGALDKRG